MPNRTKTYTWLFAALLLHYLVLCFFAHPIADDLTYSYKTMAWGYWHTQQYEFLNWNGRYFSNLILLANPMVWGSLMGYRAAAFILILLIPITFYFTLSTFNFNKQERLLGALALTALFLCTMPDIAEGIYWYTGAMTYVLASLLTLVYISLVSLYLQQRFILNRYLHGIKCIILLFIIAGFNEVNTLLLIAGHLLVLLFIWKDKKLRTTLFVFNALAILFSLLMILAPGNAVRSSFFTNNHNIIHSLYMSCLQVVRFFCMWVFFPPMLLAGMLFISIGHRLYMQSSLFKQLADIKLWQAFTLLCLIIFLSVFPAYWGTGILGQHRTLNTACFFFIPVWLLFVFILSKHIRALRQLNAMPERYQHYFIILFIACILVSGNSGKALIELGSGDISDYSTQVAERENKLSHTKEKTISLPAIAFHPSCLFVLDISPDPSDGVNKSYAVYYKLNTVKMVAEAKP